MDNSVKTDDVIFNFFKQICDEKAGNAGNAGKAGKYEMKQKT